MRNIDPSETWTVTGVPRGTSEPPRTTVVTFPAGRSEATDCTTGTRSSSSRRRRTSSTGRPLRFGTAIISGPVDTVILIFEPLGTFLPAAGSCSRTRPSFTESEATSRTTGSSDSPASTSARSASSVFMSDTSGTRVSSVPEDTRSVTVDPG